MAKYRKKYIPLKDAAVISGYTVSELRNFIKIGLISSRRIKNKLQVPFSAFEKINESKKSTSDAAVLKPKSKATRHLEQSREVIKKPITSIVPFTKPHGGLVSVLQHTTLAAAMVFSLYLGMLPTISEKIVFGIELTHATIDQMSGTVEDLVYSSVAIPVEAGSKLAQIAILPQASGHSNAGVVAGASTSSSEQSSQEAGDSADLGEFVTSTLIGIADASDSFQRTLDDLAELTDEALIESFQFENLDNGIQTFFRL